MSNGERFTAFLTINDFHAQITTVFKRHWNGITAGHVPKAHLVIVRYDKVSWNGPTDEPTEERSDKMDGNIFF